MIERKGLRWWRSLPAIYNGQQLRHVIIDDEPWFVAADVCRCIGMNTDKGTYRWTASLGPGEKQTILHSQYPQLRCGFRGAEVAVLSESGLYRLLMRSNKPTAIPFQNWVVQEVLPSIRKTGGYLMNEHARASGLGPLQAPTVFCGFHRCLTGRLGG